MKASDSNTKIGVPSKGNSSGNERNNGAGSTTQVEYSYEWAAVNEASRNTLRFQQALKILSFNTEYAD